MNKQQLIEFVAGTLGIRVRRAADPVEATLDAIVRALTAGEKVSVTGFGTFETVYREARKAYNPKTGGSVDVPARTVVRFRPGQSLADLVNGDRELPAGSAVKKADKGSLTGGAR